MAFSRKAFRTDLASLSAEVNTGTRQSDSKPYVAVRLWMAGKSTQTVLFADDRAAMIAIINALGDAVENWTEPHVYTESVAAFFADKTATAVPVVQSAQTPDLAAIMAQIAELQAANAALAAAAPPVPNGRPIATTQPIAGINTVTLPAAAAATSKTQVSLSKISRRK